VVGIAGERLSALLCTRSTFTFGAGTATPTTLVRRAAELGYRSLALTDLLNVTGAVELFQAAREHGLQALIGATVPVQLDDRDVVPLVLLAASRAGYATLNELITHAHASPTPVVPWSVLLAHTHDLVCLTGARDGLPARFLARRQVAELDRRVRELKGAFPERLYVQLFHDRLPWDGRRARVLRRFAQDVGLPVVAAPEVRHARASDHRLLDALTCARLGITVDDPHPQRPQNEAGALPSPDEVQRRLPFPEAHLNADWVAERAAFDLLPERLVPPRARVPTGLSPAEHLERRCYEALLQRYQGERLAQARLKLEEELATIRALGLTDFFLVAAEVTDHCRRHGILAAGRGSAAASICCYLLGITRADPIEHDLLFERFLHTGKSAMPDVDIDVSSARRDELLAWVEERFGATTEAMVANKITYRLPLAIQDLGRALGIPPEQRAQLTRALGRDYRHLTPRRAREAAPAFDEVLGDAPAKEALLDLLTRMEPRHARHLAPHSGGVVLARDPLTHYSPLQRSSGGIKLLQLDKDDAEALGLIKLDLLGLRMLAALERAREEVLRTQGEWIDLDRLPDDPRVWDVIAAGATMGLFQIESPSQVNTARVMRSRTLKDLAHQIALIRPGPIQSGTVHPYLRRRQGPRARPLLAPQPRAHPREVLRRPPLPGGRPAHRRALRRHELDRGRPLPQAGVRLPRPGRHRTRPPTLRGGRARRRTPPTTRPTPCSTPSRPTRATASPNRTPGRSPCTPTPRPGCASTTPPPTWPRSSPRSPACGRPRPSARRRARGASPSCRSTSTARRPLPRRAAADGRWAIRPPLTAIKQVSTDLARAIMCDRLQNGPLRKRPAGDAAGRGARRHLGGARTRRGLRRHHAAPRRAVPGPRRRRAPGARRPGRPVRTARRRPRVRAADRRRALRLGPRGRALLQPRAPRPRPRPRSAARTGRHNVMAAAPSLPQEPPPHRRPGRRPPTAGHRQGLRVLRPGGRAHPGAADHLARPLERHRVMLRDASILIADVVVEDTGYQLSLRAERLFALPAPVNVRGYHYA
jgi:hypothetical protein